MNLGVFIVETFQALLSNDHIYSVINIVLVIQRVSVEVRGELSTKPWLVHSTPHIWKEWINQIYNNISNVLF